MKMMNSDIPVVNAMKMMNSDIPVGVQTHGWKF